MGGSLNSYFLGHFCATVKVWFHLYHKIHLKGWISIYNKFKAVEIGGVKVIIKSSLTLSLTLCMYSQPTSLQPLFLWFSLFQFRLVCLQSPAQNIRHKHFSWKRQFIYRMKKLLHCARARALNFYQISHKHAFQVHIAL